MAVNNSAILFKKYDQRIYEIPVSIVVPKLYFTAFRSKNDNQGLNFDVRIHYTTRRSNATTVLTTQLNQQSAAGTILVQGQCICP